jgi:hypothetical protein
MSQIRKAKLALILLLAAPIAMAEDWSTEFQPYETEAAPELGSVLSSLQWVASALCGILAIYLYVLAGNRLRYGDWFGSTLSFVGASLVAIAPFLARDFIN